MKLISNAKLTDAPQVPVDALVSVHEASHNAAITVADSPADTHSADAAPADPSPIETEAISWKSHDLPIKKVSYNRVIQEAMNGNVQLRNFIYTALTLFLQDAMRLEWPCIVPDQFVSLVGPVITFHRFENLDKRLPVRAGHARIVPGESEIHVML